VSNFGQIVRYTVAPGEYTLVKAGGPVSYGLSALAAGDINGDGFDDVVSLYNEVGGSNSFALFLGSPAGLPADPASNHMRDGGADLAIGDLNADGYADLVVGRPLGTLANDDQGGEVAIWRGSKTGLAKKPTKTINQTLLKTSDDPSEYDWFGSSVALGDINGDGNPDLAIGAQREPEAGLDAAGAVTVLRGTRNGISLKDPQRFLRGTGGLAGQPAAKEQLGWLTMIRDFDGDGHGELTVSSMGGNVPDGGLYGDGAVVVLHGSAKGAVGKDALEIRGGLGGAEPTGARFGWSLGR
jgi:hypothetical protein